MPPLRPLLGFYLPLALMSITALAALVVGAAFYWKRSGDRRANLIYAALLVLGGLTQLHFLLDFTGTFTRHPNLQHWPLYYTLWLPVLLFFHVKLSLYPRYELRWTDAKHVALPLAQTLYFLAIWLVPDWQRPGGRYFYSPFYGGLEQALYLLYWPLYLFFARQYLRIRRRQLGRRSLPRLLWYLRKLIKGCLLFVIAYAILSVADFLAFKYLAVNLHERWWYAGTQSLTFVVLLLWLTTYGIQLLIWGRTLLVGRGARARVRGEESKKQG